MAHGTLKPAHVQVRTISSSFIWAVSSFFKFVYQQHHAEASVSKTISLFYISGRKTRRRKWKIILQVKKIVICTGMNNCLLKPAAIASLQQSDEQKDWIYAIRVTNRSLCPEFVPWKEFHCSVQDIWVILCLGKLPSSKHIRKCTLAEHVKKALTEPQRITIRSLIFVSICQFKETLQPISLQNKRRLPSGLYERVCREESVSMAKDTGFYRWATRKFFDSKDWAAVFKFLKEKGQE